MLIYGCSFRVTGIPDNGYFAKKMIAFALNFVRSFVSTYEKKVFVVLSLWYNVNSEVLTSN